MSQQKLGSEKKFAASKQQIESYITHLKPLASRFPYVAQALPSLLLQSENYNELISLALSDDYLPEDSPIDERNIRVYRLQFAFKAALKQKRYADRSKTGFTCRRRGLQVISGSLNF